MVNPFASWVEKAGLVIRWLLLHPKTVAAAIVTLFIAAGLALTCRSPSNPSPNPSEAAHGAAVGSLPITPAPAAEVDQAAQDALRENPLLRQRISVLESQVGKLTTTYVVNATSKGMVVHRPGKPAPPATAPAAGQPNPTPPESDKTPPTTGNPQRQAVLYEGDVLKLHLMGVGARTKDGQDFLVASIEGLNPAGESIGTDSLDIPVSRAVEVAPAPRPRLGSIWGGGAGLSPKGWLASALWMSPAGKVPLVPLRIRGWVLTGASSSQGLAFVGVAFEHE